MRRNSKQYKYQRLWCSEVFFPFTKSLSYHNNHENQARECSNDHVINFASTNTNTHRNRKCFVCSKSSSMHQASLKKELVILVFLYYLPSQKSSFIFSFSIHSFCLSVCLSVNFNTSAPHSLSPLQLSFHFL